MTSETSNTSSGTVTSEQIQQNPANPPPDGGTPAAGGGYNFDTSRPGANIHGIGPDVGSGPNPHYAPAPKRSVIYPSISRKIWYVPAAEEVRSDKNPNGGIVISRSQPWDATVIYGHDLHKANLHVRDHYGNEFTRLDVPVVQEGEDIPDNLGYAVWRPYQHQQAKKE